MKRVAVDGVTGVGKSTFAAALSTRLGLPVIELDALYWSKNDPMQPDPADFRVRVVAEVQREAWVMDGNSFLARDLIWPAADTLIWLDYALAVVLWRLLRRMFRRTRGRALVRGIHRDRLVEQFIRPEGPFRQALISHRNNRREYPSQLNRSEYAHLKLIRLRTPREAVTWLAALPIPNSE